MDCNQNIPKPLSGGCPTDLFGIPYRTDGRTVAGDTFPISGIILHCYDGTTQELCAEMKCRTRSSVISGSYENSFHYGIGGSSSPGPIIQFVDDENISWGFGAYKSSSYPNVPPPNIAINWPVLQGVHGANVTPDVYVLNVAIALGNVTPATDLTGCYQCPTASGLQEPQHQMLVQLLAYLAQTYNIPITSDYITFHDLIHCGEGTECHCRDIDTLLQEINDLCFPCEGDEVSNQYPMMEVDDNLLSLIGVIEACCPESAGCMVTVPFDCTTFGSLVEPGDIAADSFVGLDATGCLVSDNIDVLPPITGSGVDADPFTLDRCGFDDWIDGFAPLSQVDRLMGIDDNGCLTLEDPDSFIDRLLCDQPENSQSTPEWLLAKTDNTCPEWVTLAQIVPEQWTVDDTDCIDLTLTGTVLTADPIIAPTQGGVPNILTCTVDGLYVPQTTILGDGQCISVLDNGNGTYTISPVISGNQSGYVNLLQCTATGLFVPEYHFNNTPSVNFVTGGGTFGTDVTANINVSATPGNTLVINPDGLFVPTSGLNVIDGNCIDLTYNPVTNTLTAEAIIDTVSSDNQVSCGVDGLFVPLLAGLQVDDTDCIDLTITGETLTADPVISGSIAGFPNALFCTPTGLYVAIGAGIVPVSTDCIDLDISAPGILTATIIVDPAVDNILTCGANGLYVPETLSLNVVDTDCVNLTLVGSDLSAELILAPTQGAIQNAIECIAGQGLYAPLYPDLTMAVDQCILLTYTQATGELEASIILDPDPDNQLVCGPNGLLMSTPAGITVQDTDCLNLNLTGGGVLDGEIILAGSQGGVPNILACIPGQGLYVPQGATLTAIDSNCINLTIDPSNVLTAELLVSGPIGGFNNITSCEAGGVFTPETQLEIVGPNPAGGNIIGIDTDGDGVNDFEWCEGICEITSANDCVTGLGGGWTDGGVGDGYAITDFNIAGTTLTINSAPEHTTVAPDDIPVAGFGLGPPFGPSLPDNPGGTVVTGPVTNRVFTNNTCRDMVVKTDFTGFGSDIAISALVPANPSVFSYAVQYVATINGGPIVNPAGVDHIFTMNNVIFNTVESDATTLGFTDVRTLAPGESITVEITPQFRWGLQQTNVDPNLSRLSVDDGRLSIVGTTV